MNCAMQQHVQSQQLEWVSSTHVKQYVFDSFPRLDYPPPPANALKTNCQRKFFSYAEQWKLSDMRSARETPNIVIAPSPWNSKEPIKLYANPERLRSYVDGNLNAKIAEYIGLVHGNCKELVGGELREGGTDGLMDSIALFRGIKRGRTAPGQDGFIYIYVTNPSWSYHYPDRFAGAPTRTEKPKRSVFVTFVELNRNGESLPALAHLSDDLRATLDGVVLEWEWTIADSTPLPDDYENRYEEKIW